MSYEDIEIIKQTFFASSCDFDPSVAGKEIKM
jgi:hypothetical protein